MKPETKNDEKADSSQPLSGRIVKIERNETGQVRVFIEGRDEPIPDAHVARCFPWSLPDEYVSIRTKEGKEIAMFKTLDELDAASRQVVRDELDAKVFNPKIRRVLEHKREFDVTSILAETDRGEVTFQIRTRDDIRMLSATRALFKDVDGNTYELPDLDALDESSARHLRQYF